MEQLESFARFGDRLACALARAGLTQTALAKELGVSPQAISFLVRRAAARYRGEHGERMAEILGTPAGWLLRNEGRPPPTLAGAAHAGLPHTDPSWDTRNPDRVMTGGVQGVRGNDGDESVSECSLDTSRLGHLQIAVLERLIAAMQCGRFAGQACVELLVRLESADPVKEDETDRYARSSGS